MTRIALLLSYLFLSCTFLSSETLATDSSIHVAIVACGSDRREEALALLRSILLTTHPTHQLVFHLVHHSGDYNDQAFQSVLNNWKINRAFDYYLYTSHFPLAVYETLFAPCACQRLFLHHLLPTTVERVIYLDSDILLLSYISDLWSQLDNFDNQTVAAMVAENLPSQVHRYYTQDNVGFGFYEREGQAHGLNSGVLLLHLERLRMTPWDNEFHSYLLQYELTFYDQDLLNIYFAEHPERLQVLSCEWNFRHDFCYFWQHCSNILLLHGNRRVFHKNATTRYPVWAMQVVYQSFADDLETIGTCRDVASRLRQLIHETRGQQQPPQDDNQCDIFVLSVVLNQLPEVCIMADSTKTDEL